MTAEINTAETTARLLNILRRYADSTFGQRLSDAFAEMAAGESAGLVAFEEGLDERVVESVLCAIHQQLALLVTDVRIQIATERIAAVAELEDFDPDDFGGLL